MQGMLIILVLTSSIGFNPKELSYSAWSRGSKLPRGVKIEPVRLGMGYLVNEVTSFKLTGQGQALLLQRDLDLGVPSNSEVIKKPTRGDYLVEGIGGIIGGSVGGVIGCLIAVGPFLGMKNGDNPFSLLLLAMAMGTSFGGTFLGSAAGVTIAGELRGQRGSFRDALKGPKFKFPLPFNLLWDTYSWCPTAMIGAIIILYSQENPLALIGIVPLCVLRPTIHAVLEYNKIGTQNKR